MPDTSKQYDDVATLCRELFHKKMQDYGSAWRILRLPSLTDQIFIKAQRIRSIQEKGTQRVVDDIRGEFVAIFNYSIMAVIQFKLGVAQEADLNPEQAMHHYDAEVKRTKDLMMDKNHDYGEAWREMRISSLTDIILQKLLRVKQIEDNRGKTLVSEGVEANYMDMANYAAFSLIKLTENPSAK